MPATSRRRLRPWRKKGTANRHGRKSPRTRSPQPAGASIPEPPAWPAPPHADAFFGLAGKIVEIIKPQTEADPVAILGQVLVMAGNAVGRGPFWAVEDTEHRANLFCCLVGETA